MLFVVRFGRELIQLGLHPVLTCSFVYTLGYRNILFGASEYALASLFVSYLSTVCAVTFEAVDLYSHRSLMLLAQYSLFEDLDLRHCSDPSEYQ